MPLELPPRDDTGEVVPHDHAGIAKADGILRRVSERQTVVDSQGQRRISTIAFRPSSGTNAGMSVDLEAQIRAAQLDPKLYVTSPQWTGSVRFEAGALRAVGFKVGYDPLPENPHHGEVWGTFSKENQKKLMAMATWFVQIPNVLLGAATP